MNIFFKIFFKIYNITKYLGKCNYCCLSILTFTYPLYFYSKKLVKNNNEQNCAILTSLMIILGELFWINPIKFGFFHKIDGIIVKISFLYHINYLFFIKLFTLENKVKLYITFFIFFIFMQLSNYYSLQLWVSQKHILFHVFTHFISSYAMTYTYI